MKTNSDSIEDIKTIRKIMEESSRFLSLSGLSGIFAGVFAIAGALVAYYLILKNGATHYDEYLKNLSVNEILSIKWKLSADAGFVLAFSILSSLYFSVKRAKHEGEKFWTPISRRLFMNLFIPLTTGGIFTLILIIQNNFQLIVPVLLIFYGLALVNSGKFTYGEVFYLGLLEIITGLVSAFFPTAFLSFWIFGFGILHIIYGVVMYRKYEA